MPGRILVDITPLRESRDFRLLFIGQLISTLGTQLTVVAIPYQVYKLTGSSLQVGAISLAQLIPLVIGSGRRADRRRRRPPQDHVVDHLRHDAAPARSWPINASVHHPSLVALYAVSSVAAGFSGFSSTARMASVPGAGRAPPHFGGRGHDADHLPGGHRRRPALSGLLLGIGLPLVYGLDAGTFVVALVATFMMAPIPPADGPARLNAWESAKEGLRFLRSAPGAAGRLHHRHQRHGVRHAPRAVPGHGRVGVRRRHHHAWASSTPRRGRGPHRGGDHRVGQPTSNARAGPSSWPWSPGDGHRRVRLHHTLWVALVHARPSPAGPT
jgi:hypothetical protein